MSSQNGIIIENFVKLPSTWNPISWTSHKLILAISKFWLSILWFASKIDFQIQKFQDLSQSFSKTNVIQSDLINSAILHKNQLLLMPYKASNWMLISYQIWLINGQ